MVLSVSISNYFTLQMIILGTEKYIAEACKGATVAQGLAVRGTTAQYDREQARKSVNVWIERLR